MTPPETMFFRPRRNGRVALAGLKERLWLRSRMRWLTKVVRELGWAAVPVRFPQDDRDRWVYTVGFSEALNHPELIVFDMPHQNAFEEFYVIFEAVRLGQLTIEDGMVWSEEGEPRCVLRRVHPQNVTAGWFGLAEERRRLRRGEVAGLEAFQLVLCDRNGCLPWEPGYDETVRQFQPALYEPRDA